MKAKPCRSCGYPMSSAKEHGGGGRLSVPYCLYCSDASGKLKPFVEIQATFAEWIMKQAKTRKGAKFLAGWLLSVQPAWKSRQS